METLTNVLIGLEVVAALFLVAQNVREVRFFAKLRPLMPANEDLPLFDALNRRAQYVAFVGLYLLVVTALAALGIRLAEIFPPLRAINGALLVGLIAGPFVFGRAMRAKVKQAAEADPYAKPFGEVITPPWESPSTSASDLADTPTPRPSPPLGGESGRRWWRRGR